jgi:hypothetical protein
MSDGPIQAVIACERRQWRWMPTCIPRGVPVGRIQPNGVTEQYDKQLNADFHAPRLPHTFSSWTAPLCREVLALS